MIRSDSASASRRGGTGRDGGSFAPPRLQALLSPCPPRTTEPRSSPLPFSSFPPVPSRERTAVPTPKLPWRTPTEAFLMQSVCRRVAPRCPPPFPAAVCAAPGSAAARNPRERGGKGEAPCRPRSPGAVNSRAYGFLRALLSVRSCKFGSAKRSVSLGVLRWYGLLPPGCCGEARLKHVLTHHCVGTSVWIRAGTSTCPLLPAVQG